MDISLNSKKVASEKIEKETTDNAGTIAENSPSPLFSSQTETAGTIACNNTSTSNNSSSFNALG